ncbi:hypothetical protein B0A55_10721 [Friedmanniomyces simplex]|uniref:Uncharacterized protein n=1 Tax=Friedmanniomyces simplex TaxID=329884 RepID=A0A4U0WUK2_9PEZI|nr:hypothetical protein B0A55_10721 [Friedmanniomyces simplex]
MPLRDVSVSSRSKAAFQTNLSQSHEAAKCKAVEIVAKVSNANSEANGSAKHGRFHLLVPATSSNSDLCKLLTSAQILDYPTPVLINFGGPENADGYVQHLAKVEGILNYLDALPVLSEEHGEELVLIVDGYDVWFQLRRDVLIKRYYALNEAADARTRESYGEDFFKEHDMRQTIVFGPDKICWPIDYSRPACWAVPQTTLSEYAYGPQTANGRQDHNQPRWLNSGTIMGPVGDLKDFFRATLEEINSNHTTDSDQFYMAEVFGRQEYARLEKKPGLMAHYIGLKYALEQYVPEMNVTRRHPNVTGMRTEYHIGIDYESGMFQTLAFWKQYLTWTRAADAWPLGSVEHKTSPTAAFGSGLERYQFRLQDDVALSDRPYSALSPDEAPEGLIVPVMIHFTGPKEFRQYWWQRLWFQSHTEKLRLASLSRAAEDPSAGSAEVIGGYKWYNSEPPEAEDVRMRGLGGAWSDMAGGWFSWRGLCREFEEGFYHVPGDEFFHAPMRSLPEEPPAESEGQQGEAPTEGQPQEAEEPPHPDQPQPPAEQTPPPLNQPPPGE